jgi:transposase-like protein
LVCNAGAFVTLTGASETNTQPMPDFKAFYSGAATLAGIEAAHMIRKGWFGQKGVSLSSNSQPSPVN